MKDTNHFLEIISNITLPQGTLLVTLDVTFLNTNIPHTEGVQAVISSYERKQEKLVNSSTLAKIIDLIDHRNEEQLVVGRMIVKAPHVYRCFPPREASPVGATLSF